MPTKKPIIQRYDPQCGTDIVVAARTAVRLAKLCNTIFRFEFNGLELQASAISKPADLVDQYYEELRKRAEEEDRKFCLPLTKEELVILEQLTRPEAYGLDILTRSELRHCAAIHKRIKELENRLSKPTNT